MINEIAQRLMGIPPASELFLKLSLLLTVAWVASAFLDRANPRWRVSLWRATAAGCFLIPVLMFGSPALRIHAKGLSADEMQTRAYLRQVAISEMTGAELSVEDVQVIGQRYAESAPLPETIFGPVVTGDEAAVAASVSAPVTPAEKSNPITIWEALSACWIAGVLIFTTRLGLRHLAVSASVHSARLAPESVLVDVLEMAPRIGVNIIPRIKISSTISSPYLCGIFRPVIVLSERIARAENRSDLRPVLAHELAHLHGADVTWSFVLEILSALLWFHPLVWKISSTHSCACEEVADAHAAECTGNGKTYSAALARVALDVLTGPSPLRGTVPMARVSEIRTRLEKLKKFSPCAGLRRGMVWSLGAVFFSSLALIACVRVVKADGEAAAPPVPPAPPAAPAPPPPPMGYAFGAVPQPPAGYGPGGAIDPANPFGQPLVGYHVALNQEYDDEKDARELEKQIKKEKKAPQTTVFKYDDKFQVRIGDPFANEADAKKFAEEFGGKTGFATRVTADPQPAPGARPIAGFFGTVNPHVNMPQIIQPDLSNLNVSIPGLATVAPSKDDLRAAMFDIDPKEGKFDTDADKETFIKQVREVIQTLLFKGQKPEVAEEQRGYKMWYDAATHRMTVTSSSDRLEAIREYLYSLPEMPRNKNLPGASRWRTGGTSQSNSFGTSDPFADMEQARHAAEAARQELERWQPAMEQFRRSQSELDAANLKRSQEQLQRTAEIQSRMAERRARQQSGAIAIEALRKAQKESNMPPEAAQKIEETIKKLVEQQNTAHIEGGNGQQPQQPEQPQEPEQPQPPVEPATPL